MILTKQEKYYYFLSLAKDVTQQRGERERDRFPKIFLKKDTFIYKKFSYLKVNDFIYSYCYIQDIYVYNY